MVTGMGIEPEAALCDSEALSIVSALNMAGVGCKIRGLGHCLKLLFARIIPGITMSS